MDRIYSGQISINIDSNAVGFYNIDEQKTYDKLSKEIGNALMADAKRYMSEYHKDLKVPSFNGNTERNEIHDHLFPEIVLD